MHCEDKGVRRGKEKGGKGRVAGESIRAGYPVTPATPLTRVAGSRGYPGRRMPIGQGTLLSKTLARKWYYRATAEIYSRLDHTRGSGETGWPNFNACRNDERAPDVVLLIILESNRTTRKFRVKFSDIPFRIARRPPLKSEGDTNCSRENFFERSVGLITERRRNAARTS